MMKKVAKWASILLLLIAAAQAQRVVRRVKCDHTTKYCECRSTDDNSNLECHFGLDIEQRQTFTSYFLDDERQIEGVLMYIDDEGQLREYPPLTPPPEVIPTPSASVTAATMDGTATTVLTSTPGPSPGPSHSPRTDPITVDGHTFRTIITINNRFPGPTLIVPKNAIVVVDVNNKLDSETTTIHWHGMHQRNTPWMDGVQHISQCGIPPSSSFRYIFRAYPAGTYWYHSHSGAQRTDGLFGALIVREDAEQNLYHAYGRFVDDPTQHTMTLIDWQLKDSLELFTQLHGGLRFFNETMVPSINNDPREDQTCSTDGAAVGPVPFWSGLINGLGRYRYVPYVKTRLSTFNVQPATSYRFRLIGAQSIFAFRFSIDEHKLTLIATDGHFVSQEEVDFIIVHSGERYDFILKTNPVPSKVNFLIRAETLEVLNSNALLPNYCGIDAESQLYKNHMAEGILHYGQPDDDVDSTMYEEISRLSMSKSEECSLSRKCRAVNCPFRDFPSQYGIECLHIHQLSRAVETIDEEERSHDRPMFTTSSNTLFFNFAFEGTLFESSINGRIFRFPNSALQLATQAVPSCDLTPSLCSAVHKTRDNECMCTQIHDIQPRQSYRFVFTAVGRTNNGISVWKFAHPVHLHGHSFYVTEIGFGNYSNGRLTEASDNIDCNDTRGMLCTEPKWKEDHDPDRFRSGQLTETIPRKDTILIPAGGYAVVYIVSDNPGYWFLHCHIEIHQIDGMAVVINEAPGQHNAPPENIGQCDNFSWQVDTFLDKESSPSPVSRPYTPFYARYLTSTVFAIFFGILCAVILLVVACCYFYRKRDCPCSSISKADKEEKDENSQTNELVDSNSDTSV